LVIIQFKGAVKVRTNITVVPQVAYDLGYTDNGIMVLAPAAFFIVGLLIWLQRTITSKLNEED